MSSLTDVAKLAGVSQATVSRVINQRGGVSKKRVKLVQQAIDQLSYEPRPPLMRQGRKVGPDQPEVKLIPHAKIAIVLLDRISDLQPGILTRQLRGMNRAVAERRGTVVLLRADDGDLKESFARSEADGLILMGSRAPEEARAMIEKTPSVWFGSYHSPTGDKVISGNYRIGQIAANYLLERGHKEIAFLSVMADYPAYPARAEAFAFVAQRNGATPLEFLDEGPSDIADRPEDIAAVEKALEGLVVALVAAKPKITGLFVPNDMMTAMLYPILAKHGRKVGEDLEIISCNNEFAYLVGLDPRPATIDIGAEAMGYRCVEQLYLRLESGQVDWDVQIEINPRIV